MLTNPIERRAATLAFALSLIILACVAASASAYEGPMWTLGESDVSEVTNVKSKPSAMTFEDSKTLGGAAKVECKVTTEGKVNSSGKWEVTAFTASECLSIKVCTGTVTVLPLHLPWHGQLEEVSEKTRSIISSGGSGQPGVLIECTVLGVSFKDECTGETTAAAENTTTGTNLIFDSQSAHISCSQGGAEAGVIAGTIPLEAVELKLNVGGPVIILAGTTRVTNGSTVLIVANVTITFENTSGAQQIWLNGVQDIPGVLTLNELNNFALFAVGAKPCGLSVLPGSSCQINITSSAAGRLGEYEVEYGARNSVTLLLES